MALTLLEAEKLSNNVLLEGVIETIIKDSPILQSLPFIEIVGNGLTYNQEATMPTAAFFAPNADWSGAEATPTFNQKTATLAILGGDADVDNYLKATRSNAQDIEAAVIELRAKSVRHAFEETFIYGDSTGGTNQFDGLRKIIPPGQVISAGATGSTLTLAMLDQLIDTVKGGKPDMLLMSKRSRRKINNLIRAAGSGYLETNRNQFGNFVQYWNGIEIGVSDFIHDNHVVSGSVETATSGGDCSTIYALSFGEGALAGLTSPGGLTIEQLGSLETKDASRTRIKWYVGLALFSAVKAAALIGVKD